MFTKKVLYKLYIKQKFSMNKIANKFKCNSGTVHYYLKKFKIITRIMGSFKPWNFKGGKKRFPKCIDCSKRLTRMDAIRCKKCDLKFREGTNGRNFHNAKHFCKCGKELGYTAKKCWKCLLIYKSNHPEKHYNWQGGITFEKYPRKFDDTLKESIRQRDNYECQNCSMTEEEHLIVIGRVLDIHHIDYDKKNCSKDNLIALCNSCNVRANFNRDYWIEFYKNKIKQLLKEVN
jgi:hypothetical protein